METFAKAIARQLIAFTAAHGSALTLTVAADVCAEVARREGFDAGALSREVMAEVRRQWAALLSEVAR